MHACVCNAAQFMMYAVGECLVLTGHHLCGGVSVLRLVDGQGATCDEGVAVNSVLQFLQLMGYIRIGSRV